MYNQKSDFSVLIKFEYKPISVIIRRYEKAYNNTRDHVLGSQGRTAEEWWEYECAQQQQQQQEGGGSVGGGGDGNGGVITTDNRA